MCIFSELLLPCHLGLYKSCALMLVISYIDFIYFVSLIGILSASLYMYVVPMSSNSGFLDT